MTIVVQPTLWSKEVDINDVEPISDKDTAVLHALRNVLVFHKALDRFGIQLLHRHFDIAEHESMVEYIDEQHRTLTLRAEPSKAADGAIMTAWRFAADDAGPMPMMVCRWECPFGPGSVHQGTRHTGQQQ
jgi:hypothetical protein